MTRRPDQLDVWCEMARRHIRRECAALQAQVDRWEPGIPDAEVAARRANELARVAS